MNIEQTEAYNAAVLKSAIEWAKGNEPIHDQMELMVIADRYNIDLPDYFHHFRYSRKPDIVCATGCHKWILNRLDKLAKTIREQEEINNGHL